MTIDGEWGHRRTLPVAFDGHRRLRLERGVSFRFPPCPTQRPMPLTRQSRVVVSDEQVFTTLGEEAVILGLQDGAYYGLDSVGARVWSLLTTPRLVSEIVDTIVGEFVVSPEQCERDVLALLDDLSARRLVREHPSGGDAAVP